jgi:hypothetical protein
MHAQTGIDRHTHMHTPSVSRGSRPWHQDRACSGAIQPQALAPHVCRALRSAPGWSRPHEPHNTHTYIRTHTGARPKRWSGSAIRRHVMSGEDALRTRACVVHVVRLVCVWTCLHGAVVAAPAVVRHRPVDLWTRTRTRTHERECVVMNGERLSFGAHTQAHTQGQTSHSSTNARVHTYTQAQTYTHTRSTSTPAPLGSRLIRARTFPSIFARNSPVVVNMQERGARVKRRRAIRCFILFPGVLHQHADSVRSLHHARTHTYIHTHTHTHTHRCRHQGRARRGA